MNVQVIGLPGAKLRRTLWQGAATHRWTVWCIDPSRTILGEGEDDGGEAMGDNNRRGALRTCTIATAGVLMLAALLGANAAGAAVGAKKTTDTTIVSTTQDPTTALFTALGKFRVCLKNVGVKFIGAPDSSNPQSPTNDPTYIKGLTTCAARSNIVQASQAQQSSFDNLTVAQIKVRNKGYLKWRSCMILRGWDIAKPVPDSQGRLFAFGASGANQIQPPPGKDLLSSTDLEQCAARAQKIVGRG